MQTGDYVRFNAEPRLSIICPHCEETSETWGEKDILDSAKDRIGMITRVIDPSASVPDLTCNHCKETCPAPAHIAEIGILVMFVGKKQYPFGVWAMPSELTLVTPPPHRKFRPWLREVPVVS